ncbi:hypothetical protein T265_06527 [Opisthorchis viverrini]|uniref:Uncharacterized protein n=1 Tax=Opisthorchis viverrini TaxID=6198 RepID=A0A074ZFZ1_OPIVI|nr:hypothetical protein T265_06527 [Opisthorchis viverrini]KER26176.1 hypothetical protein T265_06527 [Opisthorchis viverrini]
MLVRSVSPDGVLETPHGASLPFTLWGENLLIGRSVVRTRPMHLDFPFLGLSNLAVSKTLCFLLGTPLDSMVRARLTVRFPSGPRKSARNMPIHQLRRTSVAQQYRSEQGQQLFTVKQYCGGSEHADEAWQNVKGAMREAFSAACPTSPIRRQGHWMSSRSLSMTDARKATPAGKEYDGARKSLKRQIVKSLKKDRKLWWTSKARKMEKAFATGNSRVLYQLIRATGLKKDGSLIQSQKRQLERGAEHFEEQFSWPPGTQPMEIMHTGEWNLNLDRPSEEDIGYEIAALKGEKALGPDGLYLALFKEGGKSLMTHLTKLIGTMWDEEEVPAEWGMSTVIPIFKKSTRTLCENHRGISLLAVASKVLSGLILRRLTEHKEKQIRENQAGFRPARGCIDHIFALRQIREERHCFQQPTMVVFQWCPTRLSCFTFPLQLCD